MGATIWPYKLASWQRRMPIAVQGTVSAGPYISLTTNLPIDDRLWDTANGGMQADGDDIRLWLQASGIPSWDGSIDYSNDAPDFTTRTIANFLVELTSCSDADTTYVVWLYWGNTAATNAEGTVTNTNTTNYRIGAGANAPERTVLCVPEDPGATTPRQRVSKKVDEEIYLWWNLSAAMPANPSAIGSNRASALFLNSLNWNATTGTGLYSASGVTREATFTSQTKTRFYEDPNTGEFFVGIALEAGVGTSGTDYLAKLRGSMAIYGTGTGFTFEYMALVQVRDPTE